MARWRHGGPGRQAFLHGVCRWCQGPLGQWAAHGVLISGDSNKLWGPTGTGEERQLAEARAKPTACQGDSEEGWGQEELHAMVHTLYGFPRAPYTHLEIGQSGPCQPQLSHSTHLARSLHVLTVPPHASSVLSAGNVLPTSFTPCLLFSPYSLFETPLGSSPDWSLHQQSSHSLIWLPHCFLLSPH